MAGPKFIKPKQYNPVQNQDSNLDQPQVPSPEGAPEAPKPKPVKKVVKKDVADPDEAQGDQPAPKPIKKVVKKDATDPEAIPKNGEAPKPVKKVVKKETKEPDAAAKEVPAAKVDKPVKKDAVAAGAAKPAPKKTSATPVKDTGPFAALKTTHPDWDCPVMIFVIHHNPIDNSDVLLSKTDPQHFVYKVIYNRPGRDGKIFAGQVYRGPRLVTKTKGQTLVGSWTEHKAQIHYEFPTWGSTRSPANMFPTWDPVKNTVKSDVKLLDGHPQWWAFKHGKDVSQAFQLALAGVEDGYTFGMHKLDLNEGYMIIPYELYTTYEMLEEALTMAMAVTDWAKNEVQKSKKWPTVKVFNKEMVDDFVAESHH